MPFNHADKLTRIRRFYTEAHASPVEGGYGVLLDGRPAKTPNVSPLTVPTLALAALLAEEWATQGEYIDFALMPATRLAWTVIDRVADARPALAAEVARYASSDTLCHMAEGPAALLARQNAAWGPWREWAARELGLRFEVAGGALHHRQPADTLEQVREYAAGLDPFSLTGLAFAAALYGSAILALAVARRALDGVGAFEVSRLEEIFQAEQWGVDAEAEARTNALRDEARMVERWFAAL